MFFEKERKKSHPSSDKSRRDWNRHELMQDIVPDLNPIGALIYCIKICLQDYWVSLYWFLCHSSPHVATKNTIWHQSEKVVQPAGLINGQGGFRRLFTATFFFPRHAARPTNKVILKRAAILFDFQISKRAKRTVATRQCCRLCLQSRQVLSKPFQLVFVSPFAPDSVFLLRHKEVELVKAARNDLSAWSVCASLALDLRIKLNGPKKKKNPSLVHPQPQSRPVQRNASQLPANRSICFFFSFVTSVVRQAEN